MTLQLPDTLTLAECQAFVEAMKKAKGWETNDAEAEFLLMVEEVGEIANCLRHLKWPSRQTKEESLEGLGKELVDVLNYVFSIANIHGVDLETVFKEKNAYNLNRTYKNIQNA